MYNIIECIICVKSKFYYIKINNKFYLFFTANVSINDGIIDAGALVLDFFLFGAELTKLSHFLFLRKKYFSNYFCSELYTI